MTDKQILEEVDKAMKLGARQALDKIRVEIDELEVHYDNDYFSGNRDAMFKCNDVLQIIDKYRESEKV